MDADLLAFPLDREALRRLGRNDAEAGRPMARNRFDDAGAQLTYELAYNARACEIAGELAECA